MNRRILYVAFFMLFAGAIMAQGRKAPVKLNIIPEPVEIKIEEGKFPVNRTTVIYAADDSSRQSAEYLAEYIDKHYGYPLAVIWKKCPDSNVIILKNEKNDKTKGGYKLSSTPSRVEIAGNDASGVFYGVQTFIQMLPTRAGVLPNVQCAVIDDYPRFEYRGMMLDVVRHFYPIEYVKRFIDYLAHHKFNYFHWHLTDDQGWRIEMKSHPRLTQVGAYRDGEILGLYPGKYTELPYGGYYTQEEAREVVEYAAARHITVIPEIDIPGHCMAVLATYPQFSTTPDEEKYCARTWGIYNKHNNVLSPTPEVFDFLSYVFGELCDIFPSQYIHVGGDECAKKWWKESAVAQQFIKDNGLK
ncbi:MAG: beta-N-acetylhexosaminidase, partial [Flavobacteriales bacterium]|nr:beta-N-acetylhexosaminidase [Flavobacteriales bacterium]